MAVAGRLRAIVRDGDVVARLGGDEFAVLCVDLPDRDAAAELAERLGEAMATPFDLEAVQTFVTASIGITLHEGPADSPRALLREADAAMYAAKESGRARYEVFDDTMRRRAVRRLEMTNDLRRALEREQLELVWHPILTLGPTAGEQPPVSLEALLRWRHPERGIVVPDDFIGLAEDTGLIRPIGEWALVAVAEQLAQWRREDPAGCPDLVSVNLSAHQLARPCIVDTVLSAFTDAGIEPTAVELEITETAFMGDPIHAIARLRELRRLGFVIAIDDFGTGYSSMSYLRDLPASGAQGRPVLRGPTRTRRERSLDRRGHHRPGPRGRAAGRRRGGGDRPASSGPWRPWDVTGPRDSCGPDRSTRWTCRDGSSGSGPITAGDRR